MNSSELPDPDPFLLEDVDPPGVGITPGRVRVTDHAELAFLQRVDPNEAYPAAEIREAWRDSEAVARHPAARASDGLYLVYESDGGTATILTVYPATRRRDRA